MAQIGWAIDLERCTGCQTCTVACKSENNTPMGTNYRDVAFVDSGSYPILHRLFVTMSCNHCEHPACLASCPVDAISKDATYGVVLIDQDKCIGCKYCIFACPYGAPRYNGATKKVEKCTFCIHRISEGLFPACETSCVGRAIRHVVVFSPSDSGASAPAGFADAGMTIPSIRFVHQGDEAVQQGDPISV
ncbi:MAG: 4Fe-4S dicluster domain-containing protein [Deltaproteobacteria bacterium]|nr:4Fe-4S dicluster domain-containing protein [Deltaproteobacteria bacterium]NCP95368.1 4Fe-4S dicluster domain-containing protein [Deltaproteobacteria bacterium]NCS72734.1 4Fe-4S dicluster domain-containing protein [Deltaproteobacteria bacterium]